MFEEDFLTCGRCMETFIDPCTLSCGHSLCRKCLTSFLKTKPDGAQSEQIPCPFCGQFSPVTNPSKTVQQWAGQMRPSRILKELMDRHHEGQTQEPGQDVCFLCKGVGETTPASSWCSDCEMTLCSRCAKMHLTGPVTAKHDVFELSEGEKTKQRKKCKEHEGEQLKLICNDCNKAVCQTCCIHKHANHDIDTVESLAPEIKAELGKIRELLNNKMKHHFANMRKEELKMEEVKSSISGAASQIKLEVNSAIAVLRAKERMLLNKLDDASDSLIAEHQTNVKSGQITTQMYQQHCKFINHALQSELGIDMYDMYQVCLSESIQSVGDTDTITRNTLVVGEVKFTSNMEQLKKAIAKMGDIEVLKEDTAVSNTFQTPVLRDIIIIKHREDAKSFGPSEVMVLNISGFKTIVVADFNNNCLKSHYIHKEKKEISRLKLSAKPYGISWITDNKMVATVSDSTIVMAAVRPELFLMSVMKTGKQYWDIKAIHASSLVAGSSLPPAVDILDLSGIVLRSFTTPRYTGLNKINEPIYLCITHEGNILVSDVVSKSVYCQTPNGKAVFTYKPKGDRALGGPRGMAVTNTGDILLADVELGKIIQITSGGVFVRDVLTTTDGLTGPWSPCVDDSDNLYVCDGSGDKECIKVFSFK